MKVFLSGAALSLAAGLLLGSALQPELNIDDSHPAGPQMAVQASGARSEGPFETEAALASYSGVFPDDVLATKMKRLINSPDVVIAEPRDVESPAPAATAETAVDARVANDNPPQAHDYPSMRGEHPSVIEIAQTPETWG